jgi:hypothetical protein
VGNGDITMESLVEPLAKQYVALLTTIDGLKKLTEIDPELIPGGVDSDLWESAGGKIDRYSIDRAIELRDRITTTTTTTTTSPQGGGKRFSKTRKLKKKNKKTLKNI